MADPCAMIPRLATPDTVLVTDSRWPFVAHYRHGRLHRLLDSDDLTPLPLHGPHEPLHKKLHRMAEHDDAGRRSVVYFIGSEAGPIKIGFTVGLKDRLAALRASSPVKLKLLATCHGHATREAAYHEQFAEHRLHGEWFEPAPAILTEIARLNCHDGDENGKR